MIRILFMDLRRYTVALVFFLPVFGAQSAPLDTPALRLMSPVAHAGSVEALAVRPDAELVATGGSDQRIHLWHLPSARQWRSLAGHRAGVRTLAFSPDGSLLASGDEDGVVHVWRVADGTRLCSWTNVDDRDATLPAPQASMRVGWDSRDTLWAVGQRGLARQWRVAGCAESARTVLHDSTTWDALRERDGWTVATHEAVLRVDVRGKVVWRLPLDASPISLHRREASDAVLLSDGRVLEFDSRGRVSATPPAQLDRASSASLAPLGDGWIASGGSRLLTRCRAGQVQEISPLDSSKGADSRSLLSFDRVAVVRQKIVAAGVQGLVVLDARSLDLSARLEAPSSVYHSVIAANAASGRLLVGGISQAVLWDLPAGRPLGTLGLPEPHASIHSARFSADGRTLLIIAVSGDASARRMLLHYNFDNGRFLPPVILPGSAFELALDAVGGRIFVATSSGILAFRMVDLAPLGRVGSLNHVEHIDVDEGSTHLIAANANEAELIGLADGRVLHRWELGWATQEAVGGGIRDARVGRQGEWVWFASHNGVSAFDASGVRRWRSELPTDFSRRLALAPGGRALLAAGTVAARLDAQTGAASPLALPVATESIGWFDARNVLMLGADGAVRLWQSAPQPLLEFRSFNRPADGVVCGHLLAGLCSDPPPWLVTSEAGRFDLGDFSALPGLVWYDRRDPFRPLQLEWFARIAFTPRLLGRTLAQGLPAGGSLSAKPVDPPRVKILSIAPATQSTDSVQIELAVEQGALPLAGVQLYRNGVRVARADTRELAAAPRRDGARIVRFNAVRLPKSLVSEPIRFEAWAFDSDGIRSNAALVEHMRPPVVASEWRPNRTWLVTIGVNRHENANFDLSYAANDAQRMGTVLSKTLAADGLRNTVVSVPLIADVTPVAASKARIREALQILSGSAPASADPILAPLARADPGDRVVITFAGHGVRDSAGEFYLLPGDTGPEGGSSPNAAFFARAISSRELAQWLDGLDADRVVLILDACHAAAAVDASGFVPGPMDSIGLGQLAYDKGFAVLVATQANDVALESGRLQQGLLTYALLRDGLETNAADYAPVDGWIGLVEWLRYGVTRVPDLARRMRTGDLPPATSSRGATRVGQAGLALAAPPAAQTPALFYFPRGRLDQRLLAVPR